MSLSGKDLAPSMGRRRFLMHAAAFAGAATFASRLGFSNDAYFFGTPAPAFFVVFASAFRMSRIERCLRSTEALNVLTRVGCEPRREYATIFQ